MGLDAKCNDCQWDGSDSDLEMGSLCPYCFSDNVSITRAIGGTVQCLACGNVTPPARLYQGLCPNCFSNPDQEPVVAQPEELPKKLVGDADPLEILKSQDIS